MRRIISKNPFTGEIRKEYDFITKDELDKKILKAEEAFKIQAKRTIQERAKIIGNLGKVFSSNDRKIAEMITY